MCFVVWCVVSVRLPAGLMYVVGSAMEGMASALSAVGVKFEPTFTKSRVQYLTTHHYYSIEKVRPEAEHRTRWRVGRLALRCEATTEPRLTHPVDACGGHVLLLFATGSAVARLRARMDPGGKAGPPAPSYILNLPLPVLSARVTFTLCPTLPFHSPPSDPRPSLGVLECSALHRRSLWPSASTPCPSCATPWHPSPSGPDWCPASQYPSTPR